MTHSLYILTTGTGSDTAPFYVGCTNDPGRRESEHRTNPFNPNHNEYNTYKYQFIRQLREQGQAFAFVTLHTIEDDRDSEYEWILNFARANRTAGRTFIDGHPLTNMKAGDFLSEILNRPEIRTSTDIKRYRTVSKENRMTSYERDSYETPSPSASANEAWLRIKAELDAVKKPVKRVSWQETEADPERIARMEAQTRVMMSRWLAEQEAVAK